MTSVDTKRDTSPVHGQFQLCAEGQSLDHTFRPIAWGIQLNRHCTWRNARDNSSSVLDRVSLVTLIWIQYIRETSPFDGNVTDVVESFQVTVDKTHLRVVSTRFFVFRLRWHGSGRNTTYSEDV